MENNEPAYLKLLQAGLLAERVSLAYAHLSRCDLCGWDCRKDRLAGKVGVCLTGELARVASHGPNHTEERIISGWNGAGTIFFARCNLRCQYCQNYEFSQSDAGHLVNSEELSAIMLNLQDQGCHNIDLVSPTHVIPQILEAVLLAAQNGLRLPLVYNTGGYDSLAGLSLLKDVVDIYLPDMKYANPQTGLHYSKVRNYPQINRAAVQEMHRQVGELQLDEQGIARRGLLVQHLVLPYGLAGTEETARFLTGQISPNTYVNVMGQYRPAHLAAQFPKLKRSVTQTEFLAAVEAAQRAGIKQVIDS